MRTPASTKLPSAAVSDDSCRHPSQVKGWTPPPAAIKLNCIGDHTFVRKDDEPSISKAAVIVTEASMHVCCRGRLDAAPVPSLTSRLAFDEQHMQRSVAARHISYRTNLKIVLNLREHKPVCRPSVGPQGMNCSVCNETKLQWQVWAV